MCITENFKALCKGLTPLVKNVKLEKIESMDYYHIEFDYREKSYRIISTANCIAIYKKMKENEYISVLSTDRDFNPFIKEHHYITNYKDFLERIEEETSFWN